MLTMNTFERSTSEILIIGGGPVGLSLAMELAYHGVGSTIADKYAEVTPFRKANGCNHRTFEHFRRWGVAEAIHEAAPIPRDFPDNIVFMTRLNSPALTVFEGIKHGNERLEESAENYQRVPQWVIQKELRQRLDADENVTPLWGWTITSVVPLPGGGYWSLMRGPNGERRVHESTYVIAADGAASPIRTHMGMNLSRRENYCFNANITFRSPQLQETLAKGPQGVHFWYQNDEVSGHLSPSSTDGEWYITSAWLNQDSPLTPQELINAAFGEELEAEVTELTYWSASAQLAETYRTGNLFLCGDAAHVHPPTGGYGMNQGVGDAVDLGWKLAFVLKGWAPESILDSYEAERRPVNDMIVSEAVDSWLKIGRGELPEGLESDTPRGEELRREMSEEIWRTRKKQFDSLGIILGYQYLDSPILAYDDAEPTLSPVEQYLPSSRPGARLPHLWLDEGLSLYDELGRQFTLITLGGQAERAQEFQAAAQDLSIPLERLDLPAELREHFDADVLLVRPDQHVAWRGGEGAVAATDVLKKVVGHTL